MPQAVLNILCAKLTTQVSQSGCCQLPRAISAANASMFPQQCVFNTNSAAVVPCVVRYAWPGQ
jgi:hypothetical protein